VVSAFQTPPPRLACEAWLGLLGAAIRIAIEIGIELLAVRFDFDPDFDDHASSGRGESSPETVDVEVLLVQRLFVSIPISISLA
jgi:hypothetical protein